MYTCVMTLFAVVHVCEDVANVVTLSVVNRYDDVVMLSVVHMCDDVVYVVCCTQV